MRAAVRVAVLVAGLCTPTLLAADTLEVHVPDARMVMLVDVEARQLGFGDMCEHKLPFQTLVGSGTDVEITAVDVSDSEIPGVPADQQSIRLQVRGGIGRLHVTSTLFQTPLDVPVTVTSRPGRPCL
jgi:hypothetical protein